MKKIFEEIITRLEEDIEKTFKHRKQSGYNNKYIVGEHMGIIERLKKMIRIIREL